MRQVLGGWVQEGGHGYRGGGVGIAKEDASEVAKAESEGDI